MSQPSSSLNADNRLSPDIMDAGPASMSPAEDGPRSSAIESRSFAQQLAALSPLRGSPRAPLLFAIALLIAIVTALVLYSRAPEYKTLYNNVSDQDGGAIIAALQQANVSYRISNTGNAILVPADQVNEMRLRLATQGLPKSGSTGMELIDNEKFGISQFTQQVNYQRALEGELQRTIESVSAVQRARVHLAIPKPSVFVREREAPSASVLVHLYPGRVLDESQVAAITHMIASSVPHMPIKNVTVVDQDGHLLTSLSSGNGLDASQLKYVQQVERNTQRRIDAILEPLFGAGNAHSQVSADIDFSRLEQTAETYGPNGNPQQAAVRSQQTSASTELAMGGASGVPGALSNTPPQPVSAPIVATNGATASEASTPISERKDATINYELDKRVSHVEQSMGNIKRLSAAIVINYQRIVDAHGHASMQPLAADKLSQVEQLVKEAMGYDAKRGDSINIVNSAFSSAIDPLADLPWWREPSMIALATEAAKWLGISVIALILYFSMIKPALRRAFPPPPPSAASETAAQALLDGAAHAAPDATTAITLAQPPNDAAALNLLTFENDKHRFEQNLDQARALARKDPKIVATVVKNWIADEH